MPNRIGTRRDNTFDGGEDGEDGWIGRKGCLHLAEESQCPGESGALAGEGGCLLPPAGMPPVLCLSQRPGLREEASGLSSSLLPASLLVLVDL